MVLIYSCKGDGTNSDMCYITLKKCYIIYAFTSIFGLRLSVLKNEGVSPVTFLN